MSSEEQIEEILYEAHAYGMREKVLSMASAIIRNNPKIDRVQAYQQSYNKIITNE
tara:strand:+ start:374 stop:538 length:165 start_codon:yes stop_codon:yes gene_type:complete